MNTRANGIAGLDKEGTLHVWELDAPHPEISLGTLFGKIWYENYPAPESTWQSSASSDDFEPKFSLVPLIFGSFKGTVYAMFFAVPLALLGAIYTSQFTNRTMQSIIKSTLEIMAAVPSVVIGFLIALWLAPIVETNVLSFMCSVVLFPICYILFVMACQPVRETALFKKLERGNEFLVMIPVTLLAGVCAWQLGGFVESALFSGDFKAWLYTQGETRYDQRNCIIIAFGLGFAVIPIIFTISEDALSNIPGSLKAASQALGATRWQTVWRVILPTASPGIFAGIIIGFGRAVGETMIVLMATGNTPILDWSPFNGMRTLSANIAVEIPEAPVGGTLYRVLFLSAVLLLLLTSILNTMAELIRQHLRNKYGLSQ
jgi:phosphate transport system permease protein